MEWLASNAETITLIWAAVVSVLEVVKRVVPGTKDDNIIVKITDLGGKILTLGISSLLPNQDGVKKTTEQ